MRKLKLSNSWEWLKFLLPCVTQNCHFLFPGIQYGCRQCFPTTAFLLDQMLYYSLYSSCVSILQRWTFSLHLFFVLFNTFWCFLWSFSHIFQCFRRQDIVTSHVPLSFFDGTFTEIVKVAVLRFLFLMMQEKMVHSVYFLTHWSLKFAESSHHLAAALSTPFVLSVKDWKTGFVT